MRTRRLSRVVPLLAVALAVAVAACASGGSGDSPAGAAQSAGASGPRRSSDLLTQDEIEQANVSTAYAAVERLRPTFLRTRGRGSIRFGPQLAVVYLDGTPIGGPDALHRINAANVRSIRYLRGSDATTRFGTGHEGGAILVETKK